MCEVCKFLIITTTGLQAWLARLQPMTLQNFKARAPAHTDIVVWAQREHEAVVDAAGVTARHNRLLQQHHLQRREPVMHDLHWVFTLWQGIRVLGHSASGTVRKVSKDVLCLHTCRGCMSMKMDSIIHCTHDDAR